MRQKVYILALVFGIFIIPYAAIAQEKESAEISLEEYSDAFQESFFEALKQSGIENYDKAINLLLECKKIQPYNEVVDFELGKNYLQLDQYYKAEDYILKAVNANPENIWYLDALLNVYKVQNNTQKSIEIAEQLAAKNTSYKENLIQLYAKSKNYERALALLDEIDKELGVSENRKRQRFYYTTLIKSQEREARNETAIVNSKNVIIKENPLETIQKQIDKAIENANYQELLTISNEAIESYPSQSAFYYANGLAKNKIKRYKEAISSLKTAIDFLIDDEVLENKIYKELASAYNAIGDAKKANEYLKKGKKGS
ncbi:hypothetical protein GTQ40_11865 [Flavobacteriaceae bacterium R38]|nr:hypothetical protein [Flavobacteriaceae bacterium R38]